MASSSLPNRNPTGKICSIENCPMLVRSRDLCNRHYTMLLRRGTTVDVHKHGIGDTPEDRFWSLVDKSEGQGPNGDCWEWQAHLTYGYGSFYFQKKRRKATHVAFYFRHNRLPSTPLLRHTCDNPPCVNPAHLLEGTDADNSRDRMERQRQTKGSSHPGSKLTEQEAQVILLSHLPAPQLAEQFHVSRSTVTGIKRREIWKHLQAS